MVGHSPKLDIWYTPVSQLMAQGLKLCPYRLQRFLQFVLYTLVRFSTLTSDENGICLHVSNDWILWLVSILPSIIWTYHVCHLNDGTTNATYCSFLKASSNLNPNLVQMCPLCATEFCFLESNHVKHSSTSEWCHTAPQEVDYKPTNCPINLKRICS